VNAILLSGDLVTGSISYTLKHICNDTFTVQNQFDELIDPLGNYLMPLSILWNNKKTNYQNGLTRKGIPVTKLNYHPLVKFEIYPLIMINL
jgi:hypothetical protein